MSLTPKLGERGRFAKVSLINLSNSSTTETNMKILLLTAYFPPDTGSAAHLFYELGTELVERGHRVTVIAGMPGYHARPLPAMPGLCYIYRNRSVPQYRY